MLLYIIADSFNLIFLLFLRSKYLLNNVLIMWALAVGSSKQPKSTQWFFTHNLTFEAHRYIDIIFPEVYWAQILGPLLTLQFSENCGDTQFTKNTLIFGVCQRSPKITI